MRYPANNPEAARTKPTGARMYRCSPVTQFKTFAMFALRLGSYSMVCTMPCVSLRSKSIYNCVQRARQCQGLANPTTKGHCSPLSHLTIQPFVASASPPHSNAPLVVTSTSLAQPMSELGHWTSLPQVTPATTKGERRSACVGDG